MRLKVIFVLSLVVIAATASCSAKERNEKRKSQPVVAMDTIIQKAIGDSIYHLIEKAKKVEIRSLSLQSDSLSQTLTKKVSSKELELMKFIATNPKNYIADTVTYGVFLPQFEAVYSLKKECITLKYDFGLRKWAIYNHENKQIAKFDLVSDNMLRFACKMFPDNQFYYELLMTRE